MKRRVILFASVLFAVCAMLPVIAHAQPQTYTMGQVQDVRRVPMIDPAKLDKMSIDELERLGDDYRTTKEMLQSIDCYQAAIRKQPKSPILYNKMGMSYLGMRDYPKARKAIEKAIKLDKKYPEAYNNLGAVWYADAFTNNKKRSRDKIERSVKYYEKAIALNDLFASFHSNLGTSYIDLKEFDRGIAEYRRAFQLDPMIFERNSKTGIAARLSSPEDLAQYNYFMAKLYAGNGNDDKALLYLAHAMENGYKEIDRVYKENEFAKLRSDQRFTELMAKRPQGITP